jgi:hypothetical protein
METEETTVGIPAGFVTLAPGTIASDFALKNLNKSLGEAQNEFLPAVKAVENTYGGWWYAPFSELIKAVRPSLTKYHLTVTHFPVTDLETKTLALYTRIVHWDSGEWMQNCCELPGELALGKGGIPVFNQQTISGAQTYGQKQTYRAIVGIADDEELIDSTEEKGDLPARGKSKQASRQSTEDRVAQSSTQGWNDRQKAQAQSTQKPTDVGVFKLEKDLLTCVAIGVQEKSADGKSRVFVTWNGKVDGLNYGTCFDTALFPALKAASGIACQIQLKQQKKGDDFYFSIVDVLSVAGVQYLDGKPVPEGSFVSRGDEGNAQ